MSRQAVIAFLMMLLFVLASEARPGPREAEAAAEFAFSLSQSLPGWMTAEQRQQFYQLSHQAYDSRAAWRRMQKYENGQIFRGRSTQDLSQILETVFPDNRHLIRLHDDGAKTGKIVFESLVRNQTLQVVFDPLSMYVRIRRVNYFREWVYYSWDRGQMRNICRLGSGFGDASHIRVKL